MASMPMKLRSLPGVKRDGTRLEGNHYIDAQWCRWQRGLPRKMGGYRSVSQNLPELVYGMSSFSANANQYVHLGSAEQLVQRVISALGVQIDAHDRTPAGLVPSAQNIWQMDQIYDTNAGTTVLVAHAAPNMDISSQATRGVFFGDVTGPAILTPTGMDPTSGGVLVVGNYLVSFGNGGLVGWSNENDVSSLLATSNVTQQKIIAGRRVRGGGVPAALLWSLDSLLLMSYSPDPDVPEELWDFDTITDETSILSSRSIIEYDGIFYWLGVDRFLAYNGVVRELPNAMNVNFLFDNLNFEQRQKVFAYKVPRFGEIWWCFPKGTTQVDCNHAVVYNVKENSWYDTALPDGGRTDGIYAKVYFKPFMTGLTEEIDGFDLWQHETGVDRVRLGDIQPVPSHFETHEMSLYDTDESPQNKSISLSIIEPDFVQVGPLQVAIRGRANARSPVIDLADNVKTITEVATNAEEQISRFKTEFRLVSAKFSSNTINGDYQAGDNIAHIDVGDGRITQ